MVTLIERCLEAKWEENKRPRNLSQLKCSASSFARWRDQGERSSHEISQRDVETWLKSQDWAPKTRNVYLTDLQTIFAWGVAQGHVGLNPCEGVARATLEDGEIASLSVAQCRRLLETCREGWPELLGYVTLGLFAGIRPEELARLTWDAVDAEAGTVVVSGARSKTRRRRVVDLEPNARAWLAFAKRTESKVVPPNFTRRWKALRKAAGLLEDWPHDALRHTYATYHYAHFQDEARLQVQMGHASAALLHQHYRALRTPAEGKAFWAIQQDTSDNFEKHLLRQQ